MEGGILQPPGVWTLVSWQHGVITRAQLLELGFTQKAIDHRLANGRLHRVWRGVYAVGRPRLTQHGRWMAAVLACGPGAALSHEDAAALWKIRSKTNDAIDVSVAAKVNRSLDRICLHRRSDLAVTSHYGIPVTNPVVTLIDLATCIDRTELEAAVNEADKLDLVTPEGLRAALDEIGRRPGAKSLRDLLHREAFVLTDSELERLFLRIVRRAKFPPPKTQAWLNGHKVDFYWPQFRLVVETDGLRYHRTPAQQAEDRRRDQAHAAAGLTALRFTHAQVRFQPNRVQETLEAVIRIRP